MTPERPLRILLTVKKRGWSGETANILDTARGCAAAGHSVVVGARPDSEMRKRATAAGLGVLELELEHRPSALGALARDRRKLRRALREVDVVHTHASWDTWVVALARLGLRDRPPLVRSRHNVKEVRGHALNRWLYLRAITRIVAPSQTILADVRSNAFLDTAPVHVIPHGIDLAHFDPRHVDRAAARRALREELGVGLDAAVFVYLSRLAPRKRPDLFVEVAGRVRDAYPDARFILVGEFSGSQAWSEGVREKIRTLHPQVRFLGFRTDVREILAAADVFVLPSPAEPFGLATVEAAAMGCPAIGVRAGGVAETIVDGRTGLLYEPGDMVGFQAAIESLLGDAAARERLGRAARERALELYDARRMIQGYIDLYAELSANGDPGR